MSPEEAHLMRVLLILAIEPGDEAAPAPEFDGLLDAY